MLNKRNTEYLIFLIFLRTYKIVLEEELKEQKLTITESDLFKKFF